MKPYRTIVFYSGVEEVKDTLKNLNVEFATREVLSGFWGVEFKIQKPRGKGATDKCKVIDNL